MSTHRDDSEKLLRIGAAARAADVSKQTVEYYILIGLINPIRKDDSRSRFFDAELVKRIRMIKQLNDSGYSLRDIREIYFTDR
jgi:DNA-binding transcriptional MerR regulator